MSEISLEDFKKLVQHEQLDPRMEIAVLLQPYLAYLVPKFLLRVLQQCPHYTLKFLQKLEKSLLRDATSDIHAQALLSTVFNQPELYERDFMMRYLTRDLSVFDFFLRFRPKVQWPDETIKTMCYSWSILERFIETDPRGLDIFDIKLAGVPMSEVVSRDIVRAKPGDYILSWIMRNPAFYKKIEGKCIDRLAEQEHLELSYVWDVVSDNPNSLLAVVLRIIW